VGDIYAQSEETVSLFNGKNLSGWDGDFQYWSVEDGMIVGKFSEIPQNQFIWHDREVEDFRLTLQVRIVSEQGNSGVQFRSEALPGGHVRGPQADIGEGYWGKLYEEHGRTWLWEDERCEQHVVPNGWNEYEVLAVDSQIRTAINGHLCVDLDDPYISRKGIIALQLHAGWSPAEIHFKDLILEANPDFVLQTVD
jgi:hypothetical protein